MSASDIAHFLAPMNAVLNGLSAILLVLGWIAIRRGRREVHARFMVAAFITSMIFLISYLTRFALTGTTRFPGEGAAKTVYLVILVSHMILAMATVPLVLRTLWLSARARRFDAHRRIARVTFPIWMYVSVTGVIVYLMLYHWPE